MSKTRIGITMRVTEAESYSETRDAIAHDWPQFMNQNFSQTDWLLVPNTTQAAVDYAKKHQINALVLTGGNDWGEAPVRDETETLLLEHFIKQGLPVLGVCRGLHVIQKYFGGTLENSNRSEHVAQNHSVKIHSAPLGLASQSIEVNSFHGQCVVANAVADPLMDFGNTGQIVEALHHPNEKIYAIQWHPERNSPSLQFDLELITKALEIK